MPDKQLTVAELLARAQQENPQAEGEQPRRRRRRSLEDGGVSVAELTGSLKAVDARPAEVKHSSVPIDEPAPAPQKPTAAQPAPAQPAAPQPAAQKPAAPKPEVKKIQPQTPEKPKAQAPGADDTITLRKFTADKPEAVKPEVKRTDTAKPEPVKPEARPEAAKPLEPKVAPKVTAEKPDVKKPVEPRAASKPAAKPAGFGNAPLPVPSPEKAFEETAPVPVVRDESVNPLAEKGPAEKTPAEKDIVEKATVKKPAVDKPRVEKPVSQKPVADQVGADGVGPIVDKQKAPIEPVYDDVEEYQDEADNAVNPIGLVLMVFAGLVLGVLVFLAFQYLWGNYAKWIVSILAGLVTVGVVVGVRSMKTGRDTLTQVLAGLAGLAMTFGPAVVLLL
ncbi:hypothetical protein [Corynebacterium aquatimens]|uniref:Uncharacterized protein n=1 Tax=Corynebacterium aquatimens TaxID=1190508 RepID=A0A931E0I0_9CORY|nr:hypothetical protein [Corynebacterium aquatimens]MBG6122464.1 hypothetical protein [Corynebacterium aquatimens]WJY64996.1 hypothetical protein CAQUA_01285 [Corynebacterium aquatimens]